MLRKLREQGRLQTVPFMAGNTAAMASRPHPHPHPPGGEEERWQGTGGPWCGQQGEGWAGVQLASKRDGLGERGREGLAGLQSLLRRHQQAHAVNHGLDQLHLAFAEALLVGEVIDTVVALAVLAVNATRLYPKPRCLRQTHKYTHTHTNTHTHHIHPCAVLTCKRRASHHL